MPISLRFSKVIKVIRSSVWVHGNLSFAPLRSVVLWQHRKQQIAPPPPPNLTKSPPPPNLTKSPPSPPNFIQLGLVLTEASPPSRRGIKDKGHAAAAHLGAEARNTQYAPQTGFPKGHSFLAVNLKKRSLQMEGHLDSLKKQSLQKEERLDTRGFGQAPWAWHKPKELSFARSPQEVDARSIPWNSSTRQIWATTDTKLGGNADSRKSLASFLKCA